MTQSGPYSKSDLLRLGAAVLLLVPAVLFTWRTVDELQTRRMLRTELAEIGHARYGMLNADRWVEQILPVLNKQVDALDLTAVTNGVNLRPTAEKMLYKLLNQVKAEMSKPAAGDTGGGLFGPQAGAMIANMVVGSLTPRVPEFAGVVLKELGSPDTKEAVKKYLGGVVKEGAKNTFSAVDMTWYSSILKQNGCVDATACRQILGKRIQQADDNISGWYLTALGATALAFLLLMAGKRALRWFDVVVMLLFSMTLLAGGIFSPMLEVEAKISQLTFTFFGQPLSFPEQVLYYQSKSVLEVFKTLIELGEPQMWIVGMLVLMFSVVFPSVKIVTLAICLKWPGLLRFRVVRFFALESSKWSMADVMALSIFMSFVAFNGVITSAMSGLKGGGAQLVIPTDSSKILPGFYLFVGFVLASLFLSWKLGKAVKENA